MRINFIAILCKVNVDNEKTVSSSFVFFPIVEFFFTFCC